MNESQNRKPVYWGVSTKLGDSGKTMVPAYGKVRKSHIAVTILGKIDTVMVSLGWLKLDAWESAESVQKTLSFVAACISGAAVANEAALETLDKALGYMEAQMDRQYRHSPGDETKGFLLPGRNEQELRFHESRTAVRELEALFSQLGSEELGSRLWNSISMYLNRLSDLLFLMAKSC